MKTKRNRQDFTPRSNALLGLIQPDWTKQQVTDFLALGLRQLELELQRAKRKSVNNS